jgi:hypothetical protein
MNILHLLWIVPLSAGFGFAFCACLTVAKDADEEVGL